MELSDLIPQFKRYCLLERGITAKHYKCIVRHVELLAEFACTQRIKQLNENIIREFLLDSRKNKAWSPKTFRNVLHYFSTFFKWCEKRGFVRKNPCENIDKPKLPQRLPRCLTKEQAVLVMAHAQSYKWFYGFEASRNTAILAMFLFTGMRLNELLLLKMMDVNLEAGEVFIRNGKGGKDRIIPIHPKLLIILRGYLKVRVENKRSSQWFFVTVRSNKRLYEKNVQEMCKKISVSTDVKFTPHMLRHTFARLSIDEDINLYKLKEIMGHSNVSTTQIYLSVSNEGIKRSFNKLVLI